ncbi:MAG: O-antigen ligase family protein [Actinomycetota bacterium]
MSSIDVNVGARVEPRLGAPRLPYGWMFYMVFGGFLLWWVLGMAVFVWFIMGAAMGLSLLMRDKVEAPTGFGVWVLFLVWMLASSIMLGEPGRLVPFGFRALQYGAATAVFLFIYNAPRSKMSDKAIVMAVVSLWVIVVLGGFLGVLMPGFEAPSPMELALPGGLTSNGWVKNMVHLQFAQVQTFLGYDAPRPKFPFEYTNDWGGAIALLTPFAILGWTFLRTRSSRNLFRLVLVLAVVPVILSMNRGLWVSLSVGILYAALRLAQKGKGGPLGYLLFGVAVIGILVLFSPLRGVIQARIDTGHSDEGRTTLYGEAARGVRESPLFGYGSPQDSEENSNLPSVGTHGQFWLVMYSHGIPGIVFFISWYLVMLWKMRRVQTELILWCQVVVLIAFVQLLFYGQLPAQLIITMVAGALGLRAVRDVARDNRERRVATLRSEAGLPGGGAPVVP